MGGRVSIIIPTHDRPLALARAAVSALRQTHNDIEVIVVDDGSEPPVDPERGGFADPRLIVLRNDRAMGGAAARNRGLAAATGRWVTFLDDDDALAPTMLVSALAAIDISHLPPPVAALTAVEVVDEAGASLNIRRAPTLTRGHILGLDPLPRGTSPFTKQSLVIRRDLLLSIGGFDETLGSRLHTELFLRLGPLCSLQGVADAGYLLTEHQGTRVSGDAAVRKRSFRQIVRKHRRLLWRKRKGFVQLVTWHANACRRKGMFGEYLKARLFARVIRMFA